MINQPPPPKGNGAAIAVAVIGGLATVGGAIAAALASRPKQRSTMRKPAPRQLNGSAPGSGGGCGCGR